jgi:TatD DNase family protein
MPVTVIPSKPVPAELSGTFRFIDIGVNLTDAVFHGIHHGKKKHEDDFEAVLDRSRLAGVQSMIITGGSLGESKTALSLATQHGFFATVGCHPTRSKEFDEYPGGPEAYLQALDSLISANLHGKGRVVAIGYQIMIARTSHRKTYSDDTSVRSYSSPKSTSYRCSFIPVQLTKTL